MATTDQVSVAPLHLTVTAEAQHLKFKTQGNPGIEYMAEASGDLSNWESVAVAMAENSLVEFTVPRSAEFRFFRVRPK